MKDKSTKRDRDSYGPAREICDFFSRSDMWLWRTLRDDQNFPRPKYLNGRRLFNWGAIYDYAESLPDTNPTPSVSPVAVRKSVEAQNKESNS